MSDPNLFQSILNQVKDERNEKEQIANLIYEENVRIQKYQEMIKDCDKDIAQYETRINELKIEIEQDKDFVEKLNYCSDKIENTTSLIRTSLIIMGEYESEYEKNMKSEHTRQQNLVKSHSTLLKGKLREYQQLPESIEYGNLKISLNKLKFDQKLLRAELETQTQIKSALKDMGRRMLFSKSKTLYETLQNTYKHIELDKRIAELGPLYQKKMRETAIDYNANEVISFESLSQKSNCAECSQIKSLELNIESFDFCKELSDTHISDIMVDSHIPDNMESNVPKDYYVDQLRLLYKNYLTDDNEEKNLANNKYSTVSKSDVKEKARNFEEIQQFGIKKMRSEIPEAGKEVTASIMNRKTTEISSAIPTKPTILSDQVMQLSLMDESNTKGVTFNLTEVHSDVDMTETKESQNFDKSEEITTTSDVSDNSHTQITQDITPDIDQILEFSYLKDDVQISEASSLGSIKSIETKITKKINAMNFIRKPSKDLVQKPTLTGPMMFFNKKKPESNTTSTTTAMFNFMGEKSKNQGKKSFF